MSNTSVKAIAKVVLEIEASGVWSGDSTFDQIYRQACESVKGLLSSESDVILRSIPKRVSSVEIVEVRVIKHKDIRS